MSADSVSSSAERSVTVHTPTHGEYDCESFGSIPTTACNRIGEVKSRENLVKFPNVNDVRVFIVCACIICKAWSCNWDCDKLYV